jgi:hypothetical protein
MLQQTRWNQSSSCLIRLEHLESKQDDLSILRERELGARDICVFPQKVQLSKLDSFDGTMNRLLSIEFDRAFTKSGSEYLFSSKIALYLVNSMFDGNFNWLWVGSELQSLVMISM